MQYRHLLIAASLLAAACTQQPADVVYHGDDYYGREHRGALDNPNHETYSANSSRYKEEYVRPVEPAEVPAVSVSNLPPPTPVQSAPLPALSPAAPAAPARPAMPSATSSPPPTIMASLPQGNSAKFIWPVMGGKVISRFGTASNGHANDGINIAIDEGEPILAVADGTVVYAGNDLPGYGNMVILRHDGGLMTAYAHARQIAVKKGDTIHQGQVIAYVGTTGGVKGPQLHFVVRSGKTPVDPEQYMPKARS